MRTLAELVPLRSSECRDAADAVSAIAAGEDECPPAARDHVMQCLRCQAEVAAFRRVLRVMATMRDEPVASSIMGSPGLDSITDLSGQPASPWAVRAACVGGLTAGAAGVIVWLSRRRPLVHAG
jgi:hypothetical protein